MKTFICLSTLLALALADKPSPTYTAAADTAAAVAGDSYGSPSAPAVAPDSYGSPQAPVQDEYGSPAAPVQDEYGSPQADPVAAPAPAPAPATQGQVGTQGFYYYYYPVASSYSGGQGGGAPHGGGRPGGNGGGASPAPAPERQGPSVLPFLVILGGLALLAILATVAVSALGLGRSFSNEWSLPDISGVDMDDLAYKVYQGVRLWTEVTQE